MTELPSLEARKAFAAKVNEQGRRELEKERQARDAYIKELQNPMWRQLEAATQPVEKKAHWTDFGDDAPDVDDSPWQCASVSSETTDQFLSTIICLHCADSDIEGDDMIICELAVVKTCRTAYHSSCFAKLFGIEPSESQFICMECCERLICSYSKSCNVLFLPNHCTQ